MGKRSTVTPRSYKSRARVIAVSLATWPSAGQSSSVIRNRRLEVKLGALVVKTWLAQKRTEAMLSGFPDGTRALRPPCSSSMSSLSSLTSCADGTSRFCNKKQWGKASLAIPPSMNRDCSVPNSRMPITSFGLEMRRCFMSLYAHLSAAEIGLSRSVLFSASCDGRRSIVSLTWIAKSTASLDVL